jgi:hypothetical protein
MEYVGRVPAPPLDRLIDDIYCLTGVPRHRRMNVPPMPSAHLFVNLGGPARLRDSERRSCDRDLPGHRRPVLTWSSTQAGVWRLPTARSRSVRWPVPPG